MRLDWDEVEWHEFGMGLRDGRTVAQDVMSCLSYGIQILSFRPQTCFQVGGDCPVVHTCICVNQLKLNTYSGVECKHLYPLNTK